MYDDTRSIYEGYSPLRVKAMRDMSCDRTAAAQSIFYTAVRQGWETHGIELEEPSSVIYSNVGSVSGSGQGGGMACLPRSPLLNSTPNSMSPTHEVRGQEESTVCDEAPPKLPPRTLESTVLVENGGGGNGKRGSEPLGEKEKGLARR